MDRYTESHGMGGCWLKNEFDDLTNCGPHIDRLCEFEDLLEKYNIDLTTLETLLKANAEGRVVVLPCKVGDTVWFVPAGGRKNFYCGTVVAIETNKYTSVIYTDSEYSARYGLDVEYIGKYLFLTRQEAEAALDKEKTNG